MRAFGYIRVSTDKQADYGVSLEVQRQKVQAMAVVQGAELVGIIEDSESGKSLDRPGMKRLLAMIDRGEVDVVVIAKLDRITRSVKDLADLLEKFSRRGVALISVADSLDTSTAAGRLVLNIMVSVSQWEREAIGERTQAAMSHLKESGARVGNIAFGFRLAQDGERLEPDPTEQAIITQIRDLRTSGYSLREIAAELNRQGHVTRRGSAWRHEYVAGITKAAA